MTVNESAQCEPPKPTFFERMLTNLQRDRAEYAARGGDPQLIEEYDRLIRQVQRDIDEFKR
jgi:hypothetical protein